MLSDILKPQPTLSNKGKRNNVKNQRATLLGGLAALVVVGTCWMVSLWTLQDTNDPLSSEAGQELLSSLNQNAQSLRAPGGSQEPLVPKCSQAQRDALFATLNVKPRARKTDTPLNQLTKCPDEPWIGTYFGQQVHPHYLAVNVGCNKGSDAVNMARILSRDEDLSVDKWMDNLERRQGAVCGRPKQDPIKPHVVPGETTGIAPSTGKVHCLEAIPATYEALKKAMAKSGPKYEQALVLTHGAVSNTSGKALFPTGFAGAEAFSLGNCLEGNKNVHVKDNAGECKEVDMFSLDDYMQKQQALGNAGSSPQQPIDLLLIDVEGFDYEVLQGAKESIKRARYLSFEVHFGGNWPSHSLMHAVDHMLEDFVCYWVGQNKLWRITDCVDDRLVDLYENHKSWSNVACARKSEPKLVAIMEHIFQYETLGILS